ncbi:DUF5926 family protein [Natronoglycomyces albus]|uniref:Topoisomerase II n=1 Tax=Natronoglycomyces albus TaxID=2811108 RepID=A0A895XUJ3_9ACTN|nr:DUF5926 family protein [Natronoglycomyces albus]QSB05328.1 topoisomerase II [Natronoglycomyces albus]
MSKRRKIKEKKFRDVFVPRPFAGLAGEANWVAVRELFPAATAPLSLTGEWAQKANGRTVTLTTVLPLAWPAMSHEDGSILIAAQRHFQSGDISRDIASSIITALETEPGKQIPVPARPAPGPRLQDIIDVNEPLTLTLQKDFSYWLAEDVDANDPEVAASLERANESLFPIEQLAVEGAHWCQTTETVHVRHILTDDEDAALKALARLSAADSLKLTPESKFAGMFRAHGLLVPVWDLDVNTKPADVEGPVREFLERYQASLEAGADLSATERRARDGLIGRQLSIR